jgi:hypothetical protein
MSKEKELALDADDIEADSKIPFIAFVNFSLMLEYLSNFPLWQVVPSSVDASSLPFDQLLKSFVSLNQTVLIQALLSIHAPPATIEQTSGIVMTFSKVVRLDSSNS